MSRKVPALSRVISAVAGSPRTSHWEARSKPIREQRTQIDQALDSGELGWVYGFSSLLGHMDHEGISLDAQGKVLTQHLVGTAQPMAAGLWPAVVSSKIEQILQGGSGVRPEVYQVLAEASSWEDAPEGNWDYSYGLAMWCRGPGWCSTCAATAQKSSASEVTSFP